MENSKTEQEFLKYRHSYNSGDLITVLPGVKKLWQDRGKKAIIYQRLDMPADYSHENPHPVTNEKGIQVCMNLKMFRMMKPLIEAQEYVESFEVWDGEDVDFDFDNTRQNAQMPIPGGDIHYWPTLIYPQMHYDYSKSWISIEGYYWQTDTKKEISHYYNIPNNWFVVINRTDRYRMPYISYHFLKQWEKNLIFAGTEREHSSFCSEYKLEIPLLNTYNFLYLSKVIGSSELFIGNQSMCFHIADAMKAKRVVEICSLFPNSFPTGANGYAFVSQAAFEAIVKKLLNEKQSS